MKVRFAVVIGMTLMLIGTISTGILAESETGTINASITPVLTVALTGSPLAIGAITEDFDGTGDKTDGTGQYLQLTVTSNKDYTVHLSCSGNLSIGGTEWRDQLETEYAIWKQMTWHDAIGPDGPYDGWVDDDDFSWFDNLATVTWFEADNGEATYRTGGKTAEINDFLFMDDLGYLPEIDKDYFGWPLDPGWWQPEWYNYGGDLTLRFFPYVTVYGDYGSRAGSYSGTITVVITNVEPGPP